MKPAAKPLPAPLHEAVVRWQRQHGRHGLPWQGSQDPYRVWLSEVMLQQTQVATVLDYYPRFLARFANLRALAAAPLDDVLALWSGLGYYSRARHLHRCAQQVVAEHGGEFPRSASELEQLPGIGRSTAAAIAAFCFGERAAILDGNVKRVLTRVLGVADDLSVAANERQLWAQAQALMPSTPAQIRTYTQGLMDLGATLCSARAPQCTRCPMQSRCVAFAQGQPQLYPVKSKRTKRSLMHSQMLLLWQGKTSIWLAQRPTPGVWAGLWCPPLADSAVQWQALLLDLPVPEQHKLPAFKHVLTHRDWFFEPLRVQLPARLSVAQSRLLQERLGAGRWWPVQEALAAGLPAPVRALLIES